MDITLVTSIMNDDIHGTDNDKKTGCGINLQKGDNVNKFRRGGKMNDLKEITCERCKNAFAKKMIKADKKEMARLLKEERQREKMGLADEGIVPLGNTTAKITSSPTESEPVQPEPAPFERTPVAVPAPQTEEPKHTIPGTNVAIDSSLAEFAITPPPAEEYEKKPESNDDFMAQFAIKKPEPEEEKTVSAVTNVQDDFLAQFAIPVPSQSESEEVQPAVTESNIVSQENETEEPIDFTAINPPLSVYEEPIEKIDEADENPVGIIDEDDIMKMFAFGNVKASSSQSPAVSTSRYDYSALEEEKPDIPVSEPVLTETPEENEESENSDWDYVANQLFGVDNSGQTENEPEQTDEMADIDLSVSESTSVPEITEETAPVLEDIGLPSLDDIMSVKEEAKQEEPEITAPVLEDIELPSLDDIMSVKEEAKQEEPETTAPVLEDIELPSLDDIMPVKEEAKQEEPETTAPVLEDIELPSFDDVMSLQEEAEPEINEPVYEETEQEVYEEQSLNDDVISEQEEYESEIAEADEYDEVEETDVVIEQEEQIVNEPVQPQQYIPQPEPVQQNYVQPSPIPVQPVMQQPMQQQPMIGQIVSIPQFKGYDQNNQPIYMYVQMQMTGYNANGQPVYVPFGQPAQMQQPYIPNPAPVPQPVPVSPVPKKPVVPVQPENKNQPLTPGQKIAAAAAANGGMPANASNISKIAVHEHSRSTSQAFINAIAESKEYANKSLTETQGLQSRMPVLTSIEDILSEMGDSSEKIKQQKKEAMKKNVPVYQEYKASSAPAKNISSVPKKTTSEPQRPLTKAELREKKKQEKIDAKFKKDLAKKGF